VLMARSQSHSFRNAACAPGCRRISSLKTGRATQQFQSILLHFRLCLGGCKWSVMWCLSNGTTGMCRSQSLQTSRNHGFQASISNGPTAAMAISGGGSSSITGSWTSPRSLTILRFLAARSRAALRFTSRCHSKMARCCATGPVVFHNSGHISIGRVVCLVQSTHRRLAQLPRGRHVAGS
jgi:hypothetical protein